MDLNIVTLNIPYPPDYGGMIDTFYRIKWLTAASVRIHLHCFEYGRSRSEELESLCESVNYYQRKTGVLNHLSGIPYIIKSRNSVKLLEKLKTNDFPILFDGLHTTYFLNQPDLSSRNIFVRLHNIEHFYYRSLADNEQNLFKKLYYIIEAKKLQKYETLLKGSVNYFTISQGDHNYFSSICQNVIYLSPFHPYEKITSKPGKGNYILYHGDLSVNENLVTAESLITNVFNELPYDCIIAGKNPPARLQAIATGRSNIRIVSNPEGDEMKRLIRDAQINLTPAMTSNGFKMKLLIALFSGRHCLVNNLAVENFPDRTIFHLAETHKEIIDKINYLMNEEFTGEMISDRIRILKEEYSNQANTRKLINLVFNI